MDVFFPVKWVKTVRGWKICSWLKFSTCIELYVDARVCTQKVHCRTVCPAAQYPWTTLRGILTDKEATSYMWIFSRNLQKFWVPSCKVTALEDVTADGITLSKQSFFSFQPLHFQIIITYGRQIIFCEILKESDYYIYLNLLIYFTAIQIMEIDYI